MLNHRFPQIVLIVVPALLAASALAQDTAPAKKPVPDAAAQAQATKLVKEVYGDDYAKAKTADQKVALAKKLLHKAGETRNDPNALYALLNVAKDMAILAANADTAFAAIDALAQTFEVNPLELKAEALIAASKRARVPAEHGSIANLALAVMEGAIAADRYDLATQVGELGLAEARLAPKSQMIQPILARLRETGDLATAYESMRKAAAILDQAPVDPEANLTVGKYLCLVKGDWDKGISYLALGTDEKLKALAVKELKGVPDAEGQVALGDGWWDLASASEGVAQKQLQGRAAYWYRKALPGLTGLVKDKVEKRMQLAHPTPSATQYRSNGSSRLARPSLVYLADLEPLEIRVKVFAPTSAQATFKEGLSRIHVPFDMPDGRVSKGLNVYPPGSKDSFSHVSYKLAKSFATLQGKAGIAKAGDDQPKGSLTFRIIGDGRLLWKSRPMRRLGNSESFQVDVHGVERVELHADCAGSTWKAFAAWIDPVLSR